MNKFMSLAIDLRLHTVLRLALILIGIYQDKYG